jgi:hypothetical protein
MPLGDYCFLLRRDEKAGAGASIAKQWVGEAGSRPLAKQESCDRVSPPAQKLVKGSHVCYDFTGVHVEGET